ncbi:MAG: aryl-sulfate sulfotransferase [Polyangiaceae bacterium]|nr:aryl-sulfate sulfotransferase [Polyangiaceae bacterium]
MAEPHVSRLITVTWSLLVLGAGCASAESTPSNAGGAGGGSGGSSSNTSGGATSSAFGGAGGGQPSSSGGSAASGGTQVAPFGGSQATGGTVQAGGVSATGGEQPGGGSSLTGGRGPVGGSSAAGGSTAATGGSQPTGGRGPVGGTTGTGGRNPTGGTSNAGGTTSVGGSSGSGGTVSADVCATVTSSSTSSKMATVGIVEWSTTVANPTSAQVVYSLNNAGSSVLNKGGTAPVDLSQQNHRTLLLGLKPSSTYTFHVEVTSSGTTCKSEDKTLTTGTLSGAPNITRSAKNPSAQAVGFIVTCPGVSGMGGSGGTQAFIIDADGTVVWAAPAPASCSRARMDYEGQNMWMLALNVGNSGGEMRYVSMDGMTTQNNVTGLSKAHHDFTVRKGGIITAMVWAANGSDPESDLVERSPNGTVSTVFRLGANVYQGGQSVLGGGSNTYHPNAVLYHEADDSYTIGDRNPSCFVKVTRAGSPVWQFGGNCSGAPAPHCASGSWNSNHGHQLLDNGRFLFFNNGAFMSSEASQALEFTLNTSGTLSATQVKSYKSSTNAHSDSLGDVQRLPNGNTLVTFSNKGLIEELDPSWNVVQSLSAGSFGYSDWRETLYGPPLR